MAARGLGVDEGSATVKVVQVEKQSGAILPVSAAAIPAGDEGALDSAALTGALAAAGIKEKSAVAGLTGKDLVIRYHQVPQVPDWQLRRIMEFEVAEIVRQSGDELASDFNLLPVASDLHSDDTVLLALSREPRVNERTDQLKRAGIKARFFTPNSVALFHAFRHYGPAVSGDVVLVNIGRGTSDLAILRDGDLLYARSVNTGGEVLTDALVNEFNVSRNKAEKLKVEMGDLRPREQRKGLTPQEEKVSYALETAAGRLFQMVQSTLQFAKTQVGLNQLEPAKVFVTGGSAATRGLDGYLQGSLGVPVEVFDPLGDAGVAVSGEAGTPDLTIALGLALMAAEPDAYSIEVLGAAMRRGREFQEKHVFTVLAIVAVAAFLGFSWMRSGDEFTKADTDYTKLTRVQRDRTGNEKKLKSLIEERDLLAVRVDELEKRRVAGETLERTLSLLVQHLPEELWIESIEVDYQEGNRVGSSRKARTPIVHVEGRGRSLGDRSVDDSYSEFITALRADPDVSRGHLVDTPPTDRESFEFSLELNLLQTPAGDGEGEDEEDS